MSEVINLLYLFIGCFDSPELTRTDVPNERLEARDALANRALLLDAQHRIVADDMVTTGGTRLDDRRLRGNESAELRQVAPRNNSVDSESDNLHAAELIPFHPFSTLIIVISCRPPP